MLHEFITTNRDAIMARTRRSFGNRRWPPVSTNELESGVAIFLIQLSETLQCEATATPSSPGAIGSTAARHGRDLLALGFNVSQVVHHYGDICQAITEVALEQHAPTATEEFQILNRCLDTAIAEAVTEHARITKQRVGIEEIERLGQMAHEFRNLVGTALIAFQALKQGVVSVNGSVGRVLGRTLMGLHDLINGMLSEVRLGAGQQRRERLGVAEFLDEIAAVANLHAEYRESRLAVEPPDRRLAVDADPQLLASAVMNLLNNAFKFTRAGGRVLLRAHEAGGRVLIAVEGECGGIPESTSDPFRAFGDRRGRDRTALGLGLSIAQHVVKTHGGDIDVRNIPGKGCVFLIQLPMATEEVSALPAIV